MLDQLPQWLALEPGQPVSAALSAFVLVALAEMGDKSQLVCMTLAARHRGMPVLLGAVGAFLVLNLLAVVAGAAAARWLPPQVLAPVVAVLFIIFGIQSLRAGPEESEETAEGPGRGVFLSAFALIFLAEFGDKTQLAVAGLAAVAPATAVWLGASLALTLTSALGVWAGRRWLSRLPVHWLHRVAGLLFLGFAAWTLYAAYG